MPRSWRRLATVWALTWAALPSAEAVKPGGQRCRKARRRRPSSRAAGCRAAGPAAGAAASRPESSPALEALERHRGAADLGLAAGWARVPSEPSRPIESSDLDLRGIDSCVENLVLPAIPRSCSGEKFRVGKSKIGPGARAARQRVVRPALPARAAGQPARADGAAGAGLRAPAEGPGRSCRARARRAPRFRRCPSRARRQAAAAWCAGRAPGRSARRTAASAFSAGSAPPAAGEAKASAS